MAIEHALKIQYLFRDYANNVDDNYTSTLDLNDSVSPEELIIFLKIFLIKLNIIPIEVVDKYIPFDIGEEEFDDEDVDVKNLMEKYNTSREEDIESIVNDDKNVDNFLHQIKNNKTMLREVFRLYLQDTLTE
jgi:hypothetical protein